MFKERSSQATAVVVPRLESKLEIGSDRSFGFTFAGFFLILAVMPYLKGHGFRWSAFYMALILAVLGLVFPRSLHPLNVAWMKFGAIMQKIVSPLILVFVFYFVITPVGVFMRLVGAKAMVLSLDRNASSYWIKRDGAVLQSSMKNIF